jgi:hypothetical protein
MLKGNRLSKIRENKYDEKIEELIYILVNLSENPEKFTKYFTQSIVFSLEK